MGEDWNSRAEVSLSSGNSCLGRASLVRGVRRDGLRGLCSLMNAFRGLRGTLMDAIAIRNVAHPMNGEMR